MRRRYHKRRWTLVCFFTVMLILPAAAVIPKSGGRSSAYPYAKETGTSPADATCWNVASDGYGWEEESADVPETADAVTEVTSSDPGEKPYPTDWDLSSDTAIRRTSYGTYSGERFFSLFTAGQVQNKTSIPNNTLIAESTAAPGFQSRRYSSCTPTQQKPLSRLSGNSLTQTSITAPQTRRIIWSQWGMLSLHSWNLPASV